MKLAWAIHCNENLLVYVYTGTLYNAYNVRYTTLSQLSNPNYLTLSHLVNFQSLTSTLEGLEVYFVHDIRCMTV